MTQTQEKLDFVEDDLPATTLPPLPSLAGVARLGFDTETDREPILWRKLYGLSYRTPAGQRAYIPIRHPGGNNYDEDTIRRWLLGELAGKELIVANAKHEAHVMLNFGVDPEKLGCSFKDVFHTAALINEHRYKINLEGLAQEELGRGKKILRNVPIHELPAAEVAPYAIEDAELAYELDAAYEPRIKAEELGRVLRLENDLVFSTVEMERNGSHLDVATLTRWREEVRREYEQRIAKLYQETHQAINPNSPDDLTRLFKHLGIENYHNTEDGKESFTEDVLLEFAPRHPLVQTVIDARQLDSLDNKYLKKYIKSVQPDGRIYCAFHQLRGDEGGTITGRYSSSALWEGPGGGYNVQQVIATRKMPELLRRWPIRKLFVAPPGEKWFSTDADQIEFRIMAHYADLRGRPRLAKVYREEPTTDFHALLMAWTALDRTETKNVNYAKIYGGGYRKVAKMCRISEVAGRELVRKYDQEFPEAAELLSLANQQARTLGYVRTALGRRRRYKLGGDPKTERFYSALNSVLQGTAADIMKLKILRLYRERKRLGLTLRSTVHDECNATLGGPKKLDDLMRVMDEQEIELRVPITWRSGTGENWDECH